MSNLKREELIHLLLRFWVITLTPLTVLFYPYEIRFASLYSPWRLVALVMLLSYPACLAMLIYHMISARLRNAVFYSTPFFLATIAIFCPSLVSPLNQFGFILYSFPLSTFHNHCRLEAFNSNDKQFSLGVCVVAWDTNTPGFSEEEDMIAFDSSRLLDTKSRLIGQYQDVKSVAWSKAYHDTIDEERLDSEFNVLSSVQKVWGELLLS